jgi:folate-dependent phosphoribosylglycinamide formyltransferase PurN
MGMKLPSSFQTHNNSWTRERKLVTDRQTDRLNVCLVCVTKRKSIAIGLSIAASFHLSTVIVVRKEEPRGIREKNLQKIDLIESVGDKLD